MLQPYSVYTVICDIYSTTLGLSFDYLAGNRLQHYSNIGCKLNSFRYIYRITLKLDYILL